MELTVPVRHTAGQPGAGSASVSSSPTVYCSSVLGLIYPSSVAWFPQLSEEVIKPMLGNLVSGDNQSAKGNYSYYFFYYDPIS